MTYSLEYNTERNKLIIPDYGRHIQKMVEHAVSVEDDEKRNQLAKSIIGVMGNLTPHLRDVPDFQHKLWDQLSIISDFKLDVDSPFPKPSREKLEESPEPLAYPQNHPKYRFYGNNIKLMIAEATSWEEGKKKEGLIFAIANHMKKCYLNWNKKNVQDSVILDHLYELSDGKIDVRNKEDELRDASNLINKRRSNKSSKKRRHHSRGKKHR